MNAALRHSMVSTLANVGRQLPHQDVRVLTTLVGVPFGPRRLVAIGNQYFRVLDKTYWQLVRGVTPEDLDLDEADPDESEQFE